MSRNYISGRCSKKPATGKISRNSYSHVSSGESSEYNYNQIVKQVNIHFSEQAIPVQLDMLIGYTRQLKALSEKIASLTEELRKQWLPE